MANKMTNRQALEYAIANLSNDEVIAKLETMLVALEKKSASAKKADPVKDGIKNAILAFLTANAGQGFTVSEIQAVVPEAKPDVCTNQKATALIRTMLRDEANPGNPIVKYIEKRKSYFMVEEAQPQ